MKLKGELSFISREAFDDFKREFGIATDTTGLSVEVYRTDKLCVESDGKHLKIGYSIIAEIFRALIVAKRNDGRAFSYSENRKIKNLGAMLDCSRDAVLKVDQVKRLIRYLAAMGYNELQLYTEDTYEIEGEPFFGYMRGRYTACEIKAIDAYAREFGIELIPCIQTLAHNTAIRRWARFDRIIDEHDIFLVGSEETYEFIEKIFKTASACFTSRKINIGMDEAHLLGVGKYFKEHGYRDRFEIMIDHLSRVLKIAEKYGFNPMMWSDMFFRIASGGGSYYADCEIPDSITKRVPDNVELVYWDYVHNKKSEYDVMFKKHKKLTDSTRFAGAAWTWMGFAPHLSISLERTEAAFAAMLDNGVADFMLTMWGGNEVSFMSVLPVLAFAAELSYGKNPKDGDYFNEVCENLFDLRFDDFLKLELPNILDGNPNNPICPTPAKYLLYNDPLMGLYDSTVAEADPQTYKKHAQALMAFAQHERWGLLFESEALLCHALEIKADLGIRTRKYYNEKNKAALAALAKNEYTEALERIKAFYLALRKRFLSESKPQGFEVHDIRLGGLINRIERCKDILLSYCENKTDRIEELDEPTIDFNTGKSEFEQKPIQYNFWLFNATTSRL